MTNLTMLCKDRPRLTEQALKSLFDNTDHKTFNLTVLDDASTDFRTTRLLERYAADYRNVALISLKTSRGITGMARNLVVYWSEQYFGSGDWLYLSDSDVYFSPGWLGKLITAAEKTESLGFRLWGGQVHPYHQPVGNPPTCIGFGSTDNDRGQVYVPSAGNAIPSYVTDGLTEHSMLDGPSWLMRWETWRKYGPLESKTAGVCQGEDVTFCQHLTLSITPPATEYAKYIEENSGATTLGGGRIGVISPHVVAHTGIRQSNGNLAPGADARLQNAFPGVLYE